MNKFFESLAKPAKWVLIIGGFIYSLWYAIGRGASMNGNFMTVLVNLILLFVGTTLLVAVPILVLLKKNEMAKIVFLILVGYWLLTSIQSYYGLADTFCDARDDAVAIITGILFFIAASCLLAVLVLIILEFALKKPGLRFFAFIVMLILIFFAFLAGLFYFVEAVRVNAGWYRCIEPWVEYLLLPIVVCFGYLYFSGAPKKAQSNHRIVISNTLNNPYYFLCC